MDLVTTTMNGAEFKIKLKQEFARLYCPNETQLDTINIYKFESTKKTANRDCHFIIEYKEKKYHAKPALHGSGVSNNCRYNEAAMYFLLDNLGYGPHAQSSVINNVLVIFSEDLSCRSRHDKTFKKTSFEDNNQNNLLKTIPETQKDNIHRCAIELIMKLFCLGDLENNLGNSGFETLTKEDNTKEQKPVILDFTILNETAISRRASPDNCEAGIFFPDPNYNMVSKVDSARIYADIIASYLDKNQEDFPDALFSFTATGDIFQQAIKMLFFDKNIKEQIKISFGKARSIVTGSDFTENDNNIKELNKKEEILLQCIDAFLDNKSIALLTKNGDIMQEHSGKRSLEGPSTTLTPIPDGAERKKQRM
jgi:hypothetical protein|tara:strand:- start:13113 stop:14210 length:1098 start_codon:yes stop_codon:yes gene_type:complete